MNLSPIRKLAFRNLLWFSLAVAISGCAPQQPSADPEPTQKPREIKPVELVTATPKALLETPVVIVEPDRPAFDPKNPNWELRYQELYERFATAFSPPSVGMNIDVKLKTGSIQKGILNDLTPTELSVDIGNGVLTFSQAALTEDSAASFFQSAYARKRAREQGSLEYQRWQRMQAAAQPTATPNFPRSLRDIANGNPGSTPEQNGVDVPDYSSSISAPPINEGPVGRVSQVDEYIRKNAAVPHSLRVKTWGKVQKHEKGYKVRVQYSIESAGGFGTSNEDMMFFMYANGKVYRKAPVK